MDGIGWDRTERKSGWDRPGQYRVGQDRTEQCRTGWDTYDGKEQHRMVQSKTEQGKTRWDRPVLYRMGQDRTGLNRKMAVYDRTGLDKTQWNRLGKNRVGWDNRIEQDKTG